MIGLRQMLEDLMIEDLNENDKRVSRPIGEKTFQDAAFTVMSQEINDTTPVAAGAVQSVN